MEVKNRKIFIIGISSFEFDDLTLNVQLILKNTNNIAIPESYFDELKYWFYPSKRSQKKLYSSKSDINLIKWLKTRSNDVVLISRGDPLWFGIGRILLEHFSKEELYFFPSITCVQLACSKLKIPWQGVKCISIHGRKTDELLKVLKAKNENLAIIPDPKINDISFIRKNLFELQLENYYNFWVCEKLGFKDEKIRQLKINDPTPNEISNLYIIVLSKNETSFPKYKYPLFGINDNSFKTFNDRPNLLTKKEIRVQILSDLELPEIGIIWDIGAGSGTIGLEALRLRPKLQLFSIDKRFGTKKIISENAKRLNVFPKEIFEEDIRTLIKYREEKLFKSPNRVVIGGCDKETKLLIIKELSKNMCAGDLFVLPIITYEVLQEIQSLFKKLNFQINLTYIQIQKGVTISEGTRFVPSNPVFLIKAKKEN
tara:strand:+ start:269 stop:1549 length:1281 start_codon:yes stop_codon:yes gene_type:complete